MKSMDYAGTTYTVSDAHPAADALPWNLDDDEFAATVESMKAHGFDPDRPATRQKSSGLLIDGRRRELAAKVAGVEPKYRTVDWDDERVTRWVEEDLHRRNITPSQRAAAAIELAQLLPAHRPTEKAGNVSGLSQAAIAEQAGVSDRTIRDAAKVKAKAPELLPAVKEGKLSAHDAAKVADLPKAERKKVLAAPDMKKAARQATSGPKIVPPKVEKEQEGEGASPPAPEPLDAWDIPIQPHAAEAFAAVPKFKDLVAAIQATQRLFNEVANLPGGKFLTLPDVSSYRRGKKQDDGTHADRFVHEGLERALQQVKNAVPTHTVCPWHYVDAPHPADCRTCKGLNWTPPLSASVPDVARQRAREAHGV